MEKVSFVLLYEPTYYLLVVNYLTIACVSRMICSNTAR